MRFKTHTLGVVGVMAHTPDPHADLGRFGDLDPEDPDLASVEAFVEACMEDNETHFDWRHLAVLAWNLKRHRRNICEELVGYGLLCNTRPQVKRFRTVGSNPHDRWYGPGSSPTCGGSGWEQVMGFAGQEG